MISTATLAEPSTLTTARLRLVPLGVEHLDSVIETFKHEELRRLTGTRRLFSREQVEHFLLRVRESEERADWAILRASDGHYLGEVVLNDLDAENQSMNFRISMNSPAVTGQGYGTEATRAVIDYAFEVIGLHRISLGVYAFNPRARHVYEQCGFIHEGVERQALSWDGHWIDQHKMAILRTDPRA